MAPLYTPKQVCDLVDASASALRNYTDTYARWFSTEADIRLVKFIVTSTKDQGRKHEEVQEALETGELDDFDWWPPDPDTPTVAAGDIDEMATSLMLRSELNAATRLLDEYRQQAEERQERITELERELGKAQGALEEARRNQRRAPAWWRAIFGGREE